MEATSATLESVPVQVKESSDWKSDPNLSAVSTELFAVKLCEKVKENQETCEVSLCGRQYTVTN